jgi:branched-chain amino acid transport system ATP-binding protein
VALLTLEKLTMRFGGITAVSDLDLSVEEGRIFSIIGPNGAGKTTVFNAVTGLYEPTAGRVFFRGRPLESPFSWKVVAGSSLIGLITAVLVMLFAVNVDALWKSAVVDQYRETRPAFSYRQAMSRAADHIASRSTTAAVSFVAGLAIGAAGAFVSWNRARRAPDAINSFGIARTFQNIRLFQAMTVIENVMVGMVHGGKPSSGSRGSTTNSLAIFLTGASGGSRSPARWPPIPSCCCSTNRPPA